MQDDLARLMAVSARTLSYLNGRVGEASGDQLRCGSPQNSVRLAALYGLLQQRYPEAGPHYWRAYLWTQLIWQPIYLSLMAVHLGQRAPCLQGMGQTLHDGLVMGYCLPAHQPLAGAEAHLIRFAAEQLKVLMANQLEELGRVSKLSPKLAYLLALDCLRGALLFIQQPMKPSHERLWALERAWVEGLGLKAATGLVARPFSQGGDLALERRTCCQYFRRADGTFCDNCPKRKQAAWSDRIRVRCDSDLSPPVGIQ